jgi:hypothetical protein
LYLHCWEKKINKTKQKKNTSQRERERDI